MTAYELAPKVIITETASKNVLFLQVLPDTKQINKLIAQGMEKARGSKYRLDVTHNGHIMSFDHDALDIESIARIANGVKLTEKKEETI
jgi:hypothetical protein